MTTKTTAFVATKSNAQYPGKSRGRGMPAAITMATLLIGVSFFLFWLTH